jgi:hypothetical protein
MTLPTDTLSAIADPSVPFAPPAASVLAGLSDDALIAGQRAAAEVRRRADAVSAAYAAEVAHRSRRELGHDGLAQRLGQRSAETLVQAVTGTSAPEARSLVQAGALLPVDVPRPDAAPRPSWLAAVGQALATGAISVPAADVIRVKLGDESEAISAGDLAIAVSILLREAPGLTLEQLTIRAGELRTDLDLAGVRDREEARREKRFLRFTKLPDGMTRISGLLDPESAAVVVPVFDTITSPRRGGPRFVDPDARDGAEELVRDPRTTDQITADGFVQLIRNAVEIDDGTVLGSNKPHVHLLTTVRELDERRGAAFFEGQNEAVSIETVERHICAAGILPLLFDDSGEPLRLGREQRLFSRAQRRALAARDGGCRFPGCTMPPSWTEAHHILEWLRDAGLTDIDNGVLLCRFHHLLMHNNGWKFVRQGAELYVVPPPDIDPQRRPIPAPTKSPALRRLLGHSASSAPGSSSSLERNALSITESVGTAAL